MLVRLMIKVVLGIVSELLSLLFVTVTGALERLLSFNSLFSLVFILCFVKSGQPTFEFHKVVENLIVSL